MRGTPLINAINNHYDSVMFDPVTLNFFGQGDHNMGFWSENTQVMEESCDRMFEELMARLPNKSGTILDAGCGLGGNARRLLEYYPAQAITGINISEQQVRACREHVAGSRFEVMDATDLGFDDETFDNVLSVEAAFHFDTRETFVREAFRVLKPGGHLVMADTLLNPSGVAGVALKLRRKMRAEKEQRHERSVQGADVVPVANTCETIASYRRMFERAGFTDVMADDVTEHVVDPFSNAGEAAAKRMWSAGEIDLRKYLKLMSAHKQVRAICRPYVLLSARKPERGEDISGAPPIAADPSAIHFEVEELFPCTADKLFDTLIDVENAGDWMPDFIGMEKLTEGDFHVGTRFREGRRFMGSESHEVFEVTGMNRPHRLELLSYGKDGSMGRGELRFTYEIAPQSGDQCLMTLHVSAKDMGTMIHVASPLFVFSFKRILSKDHEALRQYVR